ncbi:Outer membrane lipoprotein blc precursor [Serratia quinivorans]|jgi:apolipoprotein D and lipocalin family protein|uniref:outer membrane lipoprotein Blc n=1 Tax=Serratia quinivorans TaxID=137545 RepID=UPI002177AFE6|nr:outer membrane lipoprotein Blc [Serratia quinivorans]CAI0841927.1 Outer membrane lipoprotein blc precursor [Serratia quinivorans]CAI1012415.1 Outer membrane lipoprotein blc precursor [Serratia quinivorans]CAI1038213.1 Outer membrane lipoprotein blc precursor [Serratia quinivorans]CAI1054025.1 Outer membrane lipoprotein blc precursor [Serratia quinivorans]CAI1122323.1 Outer membrane lipoprotein blc precursor [Serratia quinivorans]
MHFWSKLCVMLSAVLSVACSVSPPKDVKVVSRFDSQRYLGTWYEIARLDHRFERGLEQVTANYSPREDGGLKVINRGFNPQKQQWQESIGKAYFIGSPQVAALKVSFFGPFYGGYNVIELDTDYRYALVCGPNRDYLWILSRTPELDAATRDRLLQTAKNNGFDIDKLIWVKQSQNQ